MTGRRLYDLFCDASAQTIRRFESGRGWIPADDLLAWPFLQAKERDMWTALARRLKGVRR